jgi:xylulokinase
MPHILTFDLGTTYFKAALFDQSGRLAALARQRTPLEFPQEGWCEMSAGHFIATLQLAAEQLREQSPRGYQDIVAIGFATQANSIVLLDENDQPLMPFIIWTDRRAGDFEKELRPLLFRNFQDTTGVPGLSAEFSVAKLLWLAKNQLHVWSKARRLCYLSDYLTLYLTGQNVTEAGMAGLSGMVDIHDLKWWPAAMQLVQPGNIALPRLVRAGTEVGTILPHRAAEWSLPAGCRMIVGCLDQYAGAIGAGNIASGAVSETTGTVLAAVRCSDRFEPRLPPIYQGPAFDPGLYYQMTFGSTSANLLEALRNHEAPKMEYSELTAEAEKVPLGADGLRIKPDAHLLPADQMFLNLRPEHTLGHRVRAVLEGVAFALKDLLQQLSPSGIHGPIHSCGGAARSRFWLQIKADVLNVPFQAMTCPEPTSQGAALLAARALGWGSLDELSARWSTAMPPVEPDPKRHEMYRSILAG